MRCVFLESPPASLWGMAGWDSGSEGRVPFRSPDSSPGSGAQAGLGTQQGPGWGDSGERSGSSDRCGDGLRKGTLSSMARIWTSVTHWMAAGDVHGAGNPEGVINIITGTTGP